MKSFKIKLEKQEEAYINKMKENGYEYFLFFDNDTLYYSLGKPLLFKSKESAEYYALGEIEKTKRRVKIGRVFFIKDELLYLKEIYLIKQEREMSLQEFVFKQPDDKMWVVILPDGSVQVNSEGYPIFDTKENLLETEAVAIARLSHYLADNNFVIIEKIFLQ